MDEGTVGSPAAATFGDLTLDFSARRVLLAGEAITLTKTEFELLEALARHPGRAISDRDLLTAMWGKPWLGDTTPLQVHVSRLRRKLGESGSRPRFLRTVHGFGYRFDPAPSPSPDLAMPTTDLAELDASVEGADGVAYLLLDSDRTVQWVSDSITALLGWHPEDLVGVDVRDLADPAEDPDGEVARGGLDLGQPLSTSRSIRAASGDLPLISENVRPVLGPDDRVTGFLAEWRPAADTTPHPTPDPIAPISLDARTDASLLGLLAGGSDVLFVFDPEGACTWVSPSVREQFGYEPEQLIGTATSLVHPDDREAAVRLLRQAVRDHANQVRGRARMVAADGQVRWWDWAITLQYQGGRLVRQLAAVRDVDAEVRAEQALAASEEQFRLLTENAADLVIRFDADLTATWVSASAHRLLGHEPAALLGPARMDLIHPADRAKARSAVATLQSGRRLSVNGEIRLRRRDGTHGWWQATARRTGDGPATADIVLALRDIDAEVRARTAVESERERRAAVVQSMLDPHLLLRAVRDRDGAVIGFTVDDANDAACTAFGQAFDELVGHRVEAYATGFVSSGMLSALAEVIDTGDPLAADDLAYESTNGTAVWVDARAIRVGTDSVSLTWRDVTDRHRAATALAASEARFRAMFTDHAAAMLLLDADTGALIDANTAACRFYGYDHDALTGMLITDINMLPKDQVDRLRREATNRTGGIFVVPHRLADGAIRTVEVHSSPIDAADQRLLFSVINDVTDAHAAQTALVAERARLAAVLDSELEPHVYLEAVRDGTGTIVDFILRDVNAAARAYLGIDRESLEGARVLDLLPGLTDSGLLARYADAVESGQPLVLDDHAYSNEILAGERRYDISAVRVGDGLSFAWRDVTDRHAAAAALAASEEVFRSAMESASIGMCLVAPDGTFLRVNPALCDILGRSADELLRTTWQEITHPDDIAVDRGLAEEVMQGLRDSYHLRKRYLRPDGGVVHADLAVGCVRGTDGTVRFAVSQVTDVSPQERQRQALIESEARYRLLADHVSDVILLTDSTLTPRWISPSALSTLGWEPAAVVDRPASEFIHPADLAGLHQAVQDSSPDGTAVTVRFRWRRPDGEYVWVEARGRPFANPADESSQRVLVLRDISVQVDAEARLEDRARTDPLTGLLNRSEVLGRLAASLSHPPRSGASTAVAFCDVDGLKRVNDTRGHAAGDLLLTATADRISRAVRDGDLVARVGGDEILIVLVGVRDLEDATMVAEKIRRAVKEPPGTDPGSGAGTVSIGVTLATSDDDIDTLIARADSAMYAAKRSGGDAVRTATPAATPDRSPTPGT